MISRRKMLQLTAALGPIALLSGLGKPAAASSKVPKSTAKYQDKPHGDEHCSKCRFFIKPHSCQLVEGKIDPNGWCTFFQAKSS